MLLKLSDILVLQHLVACVGTVHDIGQVLYLKGSCTHLELYVKFVFSLFHCFATSIKCFAHTLALCLF